MRQDYPSEDALCAGAARAGRRWRAREIWPLLVGLKGDLGAGKTTWVRAMLGGGLGLTGRVPSPTFTLLEHYEIGALTVVHLDLYRLGDPAELEFIGLRDWLDLARVWLFAEWPERGGAFADSLDLALSIEIGPDERRVIVPEAKTATGEAALAAWVGRDIK